MAEENANLNNLVALFLSEAIRSRRTSIARAAEISRRVLLELPQVGSEDEALAMLTDIEKDFEEVSTLKQALHFGYETNDIKVFAQEIKDYASQILLKDMSLSDTFLQDAAAPGATIQALCLKYPQFCDYLMRSSDKAPMLAELSANPA